MWFVKAFSWLVDMYRVLISLAADWLIEHQQTLKDFRLEVSTYKYSDIYVWVCGGDRLGG